MNNSNDLDNSVYASEIAAAMGNSESQRSSGLVTQVGSIVDSQEFLDDIEFIDENSRSESLPCAPVPVPRIVSSYASPPEYDINEDTDYSSGQFLLVPEQCDGGDSECEVSTQTVIRAPGNGVGHRASHNDDTDSDSNDSDILKSEASSDYKQLISRRKARSRRESTTSRSSAKLELDIKERVGKEERRQSTRSALCSVEQPFLEESLTLRPLANSKSFTSIGPNAESHSGSSTFSGESRPSNNLASQSIFHFVRSENVLSAGGIGERAFSPSSYASATEGLYPLNPQHHHHFQHHVAVPHQSPSSSPHLLQTGASARESSQSHCQAAHLRLTNEPAKGPFTVSPQVGLSILDANSVPSTSRTSSSSSSSASNLPQLQVSASSSQPNI